MTNVILQMAPVPMQLTQRLQQHFTLVNYAQLTPEQQVELLPQVRVLLINGETSLSDAAMACFPNLQLIAVFGVGYERELPLDTQGQRQPARHSRSGSYWPCYRPARFGV